MMDPNAVRLDVLLTGDIEDYPIAVAWSPNGRWLAVGGSAGSVVLYDLQRSGENRRWPVHEQGLHRIAWHPSQPLFATSGQDARVRLWSMEQQTCAPVVEIPAAHQWVEHLGWRPDGKQLAFSSGRAIAICSVSGDSQRSYRHPESTVSAISWRPRGAQLAASGYGGVLVFDVLDERSKPQHLPLKGSLTSLCWSPDGRVIAAPCQDNSVHFWRLRSGADATIGGFERKPTQLDWSPNSRWLATGGGSTVALWPFDTRGSEGRSPTLLDFHVDSLTAIAFATGAPYVASACRSGYLCIWRVGNWQAPACALQMNDPIELIAWNTRAGRPRITALTSSGRLAVWEVSRTQKQIATGRKPGDFVAAAADFRPVRG